MVTSLDVANVSAVAMVLCMVIPMYIWCLFLLHKHWKQQYFIKRRQFFIVAQMTGLTLWSISASPFSALIYFYGDELKFLSNNYFTIYVCAIVPLPILISNLYLIRIYLLYYSMELSQLIKNKNWRMAINPIKIANNWFLNINNQKKYYNNTKYLIIIAIFAVVIESFLVSFGLYIIYIPFFSVIVYLITTAIRVKYMYTRI